MVRHLNSRVCHVWLIISRLCWVSLYNILMAFVLCRNGILYEQGLRPESLNMSIFKTSLMGPRALYFISILMQITTAVMSIRSTRFQLFSKQLECDVISSFWAPGFSVCANKCLSIVNVCEAISIEKAGPFDTHVCKVCLVKAARSHKKPFTVPSNDTRIYRREIDLEKGTDAIITCM